MLLIGKVELGSVVIPGITAIIVKPSGARNRSEELGISIESKENKRVGPVTCQTWSNLRSDISSWGPGIEWEAILWVIDIPYGDERIGQNSYMIPVWRKCNNAIFMPSSWSIRLITSQVFVSHNSTNFSDAVTTIFPEGETAIIPCTSSWVSIVAAWFLARFTSHILTIPL